MKLNLGPVFLAAALVVTGCGLEGLDRIATNQHEERAGQHQDAVIRWQFDTHG